LDKCDDKTTTIYQSRDQSSGGFCGDWTSLQVDTWNVLEDAIERRDSASLVANDLVKLNDTLEVFAGLSSSESRELKDLAREWKKRHTASKKIYARSQKAFDAISNRISKTLARIDELKKLDIQKE